MNTELEYRYRDASNYKWTTSIVLSGSLSIQDINPYLLDGEFIVPQAVGLESLTPCPRNEDDHDWHEVVSLTPTEAKSSAISAEEFFLRVQKCHDNGWYDYLIGGSIG